MSLLTRLKIWRLNRKTPQAWTVTPVDPKTDMAPAQTHEHDCTGEDGS